MRGVPPGGKARARAGWTAVAVIADLSALLCLALGLIGAAVTAVALGVAALRLRSAAGVRAGGRLDRW